MSGPAPIPAYLEAAVQAACAILAPVLQGVTSEGGTPISYPIRAAWNQERMAFPEVTLDVLTGRAPQQYALGLLDWDETAGPTGTKTYGRIAFDSKVVLTVYTRSAPERDYLLDLLSSGYNGAWGPDGGGFDTDSITKVALATANIITTGEEVIVKRDAVQSAMRPEGEYYEGVLTLTCDIFSTWQRPGVVLGTPATVQTVAVPDSLVLTNPIGPVEAVVGTSVAQALSLTVANSRAVASGLYQVVAGSATTFDLQQWQDGTGGTGGTGGAGTEGQWTTLAAALTVGTHYTGVPGVPSLAYIPGIDLFIAMTPPLVAGDSAQVQTGVPRTYAAVTTSLSV